MNISRQGVRGNPNRLIPASDPCSRSDPRYIEIRAAAQFPMADEAWNKPIANGLAWSGMVSARSVTAAANTPPTPSPVRSR